jgi:hypothetical protein
VCHRERRQAVAVAFEHLARRELDEADVVRQLADYTAERRDQVDEAAWAVHVERLIAATEREGLEHARQAENVVGVKVGQEDLTQVDETDRRAQQLALRSLRAVEEEPVAAATDHQSGR